MQWPSFFYKQVALAGQSFGSTTPDSFPATSGSSALVGWYQNHFLKLFVHIKISTNNQA